jgi:glycosyltransferase involved in cell wall biosynthesis
VPPDVPPGARDDLVRETTMTSAIPPVSIAGRHGPLVSIGIPLYRSQRFADRVLRNIEAVAHPNLEVIVSDRHSEDDAVDRIAVRFARDPRVRIVGATDRLTWVEHYNWLLDTARGEYFMWMPHDDEFPAGYVSSLVAALEEHPDAVLAHGRIERVDLEGRPYGDRHRAREPADAPGPWSPRAAARLLVRRDTEPPFRGVFRRDVVRREGLSIRPSPGTVAADAYWVFALALLGPFRHVAECVCRKAYYPTSTHAQWRPMDTRQVLDGRRILRGYLADLVPDRAVARACARDIDRWTALGIAGVVARRCRVPAGLRRSAERALNRRR